MPLLILLKIVGFESQRNHHITLFSKVKFGVIIGTISEK